MKTDEEIKQEARAYWDEIINDVSESWELKFQRDANKKGKKIVRIPSIGAEDEVTIPDFKSPKPLFDCFAISKLLNIGYYEAYIFVDTVFKERPIQYESFFFDGEMYHFVLRVRKRALEIHKEHKQRLPNKISALKKLEKSLMRHRPETNKMAYQEAIANLIYLHKFSDALIDYLENEWLSSYELDNNLDKNPKRQPCWNAILLGCYQELRKHHKHVDSCEITARLLAIIYPKIWTGNILKIRESIRRRIDKMLPHLASSPL